MWFAVLLNIKRGPLPSEARLQPIYILDGLRAPIPSHTPNSYSQCLAHPRLRGSLEAPKLHGVQAASPPTPALGLLV